MSAARLLWRFFLAAWLILGASLAQAEVAVPPLKAGESVTLTVAFSEAVTVADGTPTLSVDSGGSASLTSCSGRIRTQSCYWGASRS